MDDDLEPSSVHQAGEIISMIVGSNIQGNNDQGDGSDDGSIHDDDNSSDSDLDLHRVLTEHVKKIQAHGKTTKHLTAAKPASRKPSLKYDIVESEECRHLSCLTSSLIIDNQIPLQHLIFIALFVGLMERMYHFR